MQIEIQNGTVGHSPGWGEARWHQHGQGVPREETHGQGIEIIPDASMSQVEASFLVVGFIS